jgi:hypothetical protein
MHNHGHFSASFLSLSISHHNGTRTHPGTTEPLLLRAPQAISNKETDESDNET